MNSMKKLYIIGISLIVMGLIYILYLANKETLSKILPAQSDSAVDVHALPSPHLSSLPEPTILPPVTEETGPYVKSPAEGAVIQSPLIVTGTVPPGWMFEGSFSIKLFTYSDELLAQVNAVEKTPGSWQSGESVEFTANLSYKTKAKYGYLLLEKSNPSGLEENAVTYKHPVVFSE